MKKLKDKLEKVATQIPGCYLAKLDMMVPNNYIEHLIKEYEKDPNNEAKFIKVVKYQGKNFAMDANTLKDLKITTSKVNNKFAFDETKCVQELDKLAKAAPIK